MVAVAAVVLLSAAGSASGQGQGRVVLHVAFSNVTFRSFYTVTVAGRVCHRACSVAVARGAVVTLQARPWRDPSGTTEARPGGFFTRWSRGCVGTAPVCIVAVDSPTTVVAGFVPFWGELLVAATGPGAVSGGGGIRWYPLGSTVRLQAVARAGAEFAGWHGACSSFHADVCTLRVGRSGLHAEPRQGYSDEDATAVEEVEATFARPAPAGVLEAVTVEADGPALTGTPGGIRCEQRQCSTELAAGTKLDLSTEGLASWGGACSRSFNDSGCHLIVDGPVTVEVSTASVSAGAGLAGGDLPLAIGGRGSVTAVGASLKLLSSGSNQCTQSCGCASGCVCRQSCDFTTTGSGAVSLTAKPARAGDQVRWDQQCRRARTSATCTLQKPVLGASVWATFGPPAGGRPR